MSARYASYLDTITYDVSLCPTPRESYVFLSGTIQPTGSGHISLRDQCFCTDPSMGTNGRCYPVAYCGSCDLNRSGECPQENQNLRIPGV